MAGTCKVIMQFLKEEKGKLPKNKLKRTLKISAAFFLICLGILLWSVNRLSTYGEKIQELKNAQARLELENQILENKIAAESSLNSIEKKAVALGFDSVKNYQYLKSPELASLR